MTEQSSTGFLSWVHGCDIDVFGTFGKLAAVWFDEVLLEVPSPDFVDVLIDDLGENTPLAPDTERELRRLFQPVQKADPQYEMKPTPIDDHAFFNRTAELVQEALQLEYPGMEGFGAFREAAGATYGAIRSVESWSRILTGQRCDFIALPHEEVVIQAMAAGQSAIQFADFRETMAVRIPDASALHWDWVVELRHDKNINAYRRKMTEASEFAREGDGKSVAEVLQELEYIDMKAHVLKNKPDIPSALIKGVAGNMLLPIPINPFAIATAVQEVKDAYKTKKALGWLYFSFKLTDQK